MPEDHDEDYGLEYVPNKHLTEDAGMATTLSYTGQKTLAQLCQEGGVPLINFLLAHAMPSHEQSTLPSTQSVRDWHFQDILWLPTREREEWKKACLEELESLCVIVTTISHLYFVLFITFVTFAVATLLFVIVYSYTYTI